MANAVVLLAGLLSLSGSVLASSCTELNLGNLNRITIPLPGPGLFFGNSTLPASCMGEPPLSCTTSPITDGDYGDTSNGVVSSEFMAWISNSRLTFTIVGTDTFSQLRRINLAIYHDRTVGADLPNITLSASISETMAGTAIPYTILDNEDLEAGDAQVRNITLVLVGVGVGAGMQRIEGNRFHIGFSFTSGIQLFAISEVELCTDTATFEAETLVVEQSSEAGELVNGSVLVPANRTGVTPDTVMRLSCTVANQGRFQWEWTVPDSLSPPSQLLLDATRTSVIEVPQSGMSVGEYTCTASYHSDTGLVSSGATTFTVEPELVLYPAKRSVSIDSTVVLLECILAGEVSTGEEIKWSFNGRVLGGDSEDKYSIFIITENVCPYGTCQRSQLQINPASANDVGTYTCSFSDLSEDITVTISPPSTSPMGTSTPTTSTGATDDPTNSADLVTIIAGTAGGATGAIVIVVVLILVFCCCNRRAAMKTSDFSQSNGNAYDEDSDGLYQVIPKKEVPPPLPSRPPPGSYATIEPTDNGHIELAKLAPATTTLRDSIVSMPADIGAPSSEHALAKLSVAANGPEFNLQYKHNPLYSSADNLIAAAPALPDKKFPSTPGILEEENALNIYALPHKPPPLPARMTSPELKEASPDPIYTEAELSPTQFQQPLQQQSPTLSPSQFQVMSLSTSSPDSTSSKICPYASIYADPKPLMKEEGPIEVRPYHIKEIRPLGMGQFGEVMLAETHGLSLRDLKLGDSTEKSVGIQVAVKRLKQNADKVVKETFEKEIKFMARLNHMNVIRMLAICPTGQPFILMEYMEFGDLNQYLQKFEVAPSGREPTDKQISVPLLLYACIQISNGMRYLASLHFIHRDLATRNCLVGKDNVIKIADFGMSRSLYSSHYYRIQGRAILPIRWMANECFYGRFSEKTDVWAYGVSMWEVFMLAKVQPFDEMSDQQVIENAVNVEKMKVLQKPKHCPEEVYEVMLRCWEKDPDKRINFEDVYSSLAALHTYSDI